MQTIEYWLNRNHILLQNGLPRKTSPWKTEHSRSEQSKMLINVAIFHLFLPSGSSTSRGKLQWFKMPYNKVLKIVELRKVVMILELVVGNTFGNVLDILLLYMKHHISEYLFDPFQKQFWQQSSLFESRTTRWRWHTKQVRVNVSTDEARWH